jgi:uncharacterized lipoprotein YbaY
MSMVPPQPCVMLACEASKMASSASLASSARHSRRISVPPGTSVSVVVDKV